MIALGYEEVALDDFWSTFLQELDALPSMEMGQLEVRAGVPTLRYSGTAAAAAVLSFLFCCLVWGVPFSVWVSIDPVVFVWCTLHVCQVPGKSVDYGSSAPSQWCSHRPIYERDVVHVSAGEWGWRRGVLCPYFKEFHFNPIVAIPNLLPLFYRRIGLNSPRRRRRPIPPSSLSLLYLC